MIYIEYNIVASFQILIHCSLFNDFFIIERRSLGSSSPFGIFKIHMINSKFLSVNIIILNYSLKYKKKYLRISLHPFKVIHERPGSVSCDFTSIINGIQHCIQIQMIIFNPVVVFQLSSVRESILEYD